MREILKRLEAGSQSEEGKIQGIYNFGKDDIKFGFNESDDILASKRSFGSSTISAKR
jgi:hypothetical protein